MSLTLHATTPDIATYRHLRREAGLSPKTTEAAAIGLPNSLYAVQVFDGANVVGMGRVVGDGGLFFQVVDIAVLPAYQGQGLGKRIMAAITDWLRANVPESGYVSLLADGEAQRLYTQYGFVATAPASVGMCYQPEGK